MAMGPDGTVYSVNESTDGTFAVEILRPSSLPRFKPGFKTRPEAEQWIYERICEVGSALPSYAGH